MVTRVSKYDALDVVPGPGSNIGHPLSVFPSLHRVLRDQFPGFISTMSGDFLPGIVVSESIRTISKTTR